METYRSIWNNFYNYLKEHWKIKDCELTTQDHVVAYMDYKIEYYPSQQYMQKISSSFGKLEIALTKFSHNVSRKNITYDFSIRQYILDESKNLEFLADNYRNRAYLNPELLISNLHNPLHQLAANIQYEGGARLEGVTLIKQDQIKEPIYDPITQVKKGVITTKEKGGKVGDILINIDTYIYLLEILSQNPTFKIDKQKYYNDLKQAAAKSNEKQEASHGLRWNFAKRRMYEYAKDGYSFEESLQQVSYEMKHNRASITMHYL